MSAAFEGVRKLERQRKVQEWSMKRAKMFDDILEALQAVQSLLEDLLKEEFAAGLHALDCSCICSVDIPEVKRTEALVAHQSSD